METETKTEVVKLFGETYKIDFFVASQTVLISKRIHKKNMFRDKYVYETIYQGFAERILLMAEVIKKLTK